MPILAADFTLDRGEDGILTIVMSPPQAVGGWDVQSLVTNRAGGSSGLITKSCSSGFNGVSGISVTNSGAGVLAISYNSSDTSGWDQGAYSNLIRRLNSGFVTDLAVGHFLVR